MWNSRKAQTVLPRPLSFYLGFLAGAVVFVAGTFVSFLASVLLPPAVAVDDLEFVLEVDVGASFFGVSRAILFKTGTASTKVRTTKPIRRICTIPPDQEISSARVFDQDKFTKGKKSTALP